MGAIYLFPRIDPSVINIQNDEKFILDFLLQEHVLMVQGSGFNILDRNHFRIVFLPREDDLRQALNKLASFLESYSQ